MKNKNLKTVLLGLGITVLTSTSMFAQRQERGDKKERPSIDKLFESMDTNQDAKLSNEEVTGPLRDHFERIDVNEDGFLTVEEVQKAPRPKRREGEGEGE